MNKILYPYIFLFFIVLVCVVYMSFFYKKQDKINFPIDLVYLWVDGNDEEWLKKKNYWQEKLMVTEKYSTSAARFRDRGELKHSLRSVDKYMPWIRYIFIVTDNQIPEWLNLNNPKIKIIDHKQILPQDALPVFNSMAIETGIANIEGLAEHFIYSNDDVFVNKKISPDFFFTEEGVPVFYDDISAKKNRKKWAEENPGAMWVKLDKRVESLLQSKKMKYHNLTDTHTMSSFRKSDFLNTLRFFKEEFNKTAHSKFRDPENVNLSIIYEVLYNQKKIAFKDSQLINSKFEDGPAGILVIKNIEDIVKLKPCLFCLNDDSSLSQQDIKVHINFLKKKYPKKSCFEK